MSYRSTPYRFVHISHRVGFYTIILRVQKQAIMSFCLYQYIKMQTFGHRMRCIFFYRKEYTPVDFLIFRVDINKIYN